MQEGVWIFLERVLNELFHHFKLEYSGCCIPFSWRSLASNSVFQYHNKNIIVFLWQLQHQDVPLLVLAVIRVAKIGAANTCATLTRLVTCIKLLCKYCLRHFCSLVNRRANDSYSQFFLSQVLSPQLVITTAHTRIPLPLVHFHSVLPSDWCGLRLTPGP